jgi:hypothetical protein
LAKALSQSYVTLTPAADQRGSVPGPGQDQDDRLDVHGRRRPHPGVQGTYFIKLHFGRKLVRSNIILKFGTNFHQKTFIRLLRVLFIKSIANSNLGFFGILKLNKVIVTNSDWTKYVRGFP